LLNFYTFRKLYHAKKKITIIDDNIFLILPEDGYSCDTIRGIPNGLGEFVEPLARAGEIL
jgi:afadin